MSAIIVVVVVLLVVLIVTIFQLKPESESTGTLLREQVPSSASGISRSELLSGEQLERTETSAGPPLSDLLPETLVVLDLETTGLDPKRNEIIEIGAIRAVLSAEKHATFQTFVKPVHPIPASISIMTGITQAMVDAEGAELADALQQFKSFIGDLPIVTYNAEFDMNFLHAAAEKHGITFENCYTCALKQARRAWPELQSHRLTDMARMGNLSNDDAHRALGDCQRALIVFISATTKLGRKVRWSKPASNCAEDTKDI